MTDLTYPAKGLDLYAGTLTQEQLVAAKAAGMQFILHYYGGSKGKDLTAASAIATSDLDMWCGAVFEAGGDQASYFSGSQGVIDATEAIAQATAVGQPKGSAIYFAVDFGPLPADMADITAYFGAVASRVHTAGYKMGAYACGSVLVALKALGLIDYDWLAGALGWPWSRAYQNPAMMQYPTSNLAGVGSVDLDTAFREAGLFQVEVPNA